jgi:hypothetical protein
LSVIQLNNELIQFNEVVAVVIQLLLVVDAWSEEDSDDTILVLVGLNINGDCELLGIHTTSAANNVHVVVEVVEISLPVVDLLALSVEVVVVAHVAVRVSVIFVVSVEFVVNIIFTVIISILSIVLSIFVVEVLEIVVAFIGV